MVKPYTPDRGDIVWLSFDPQIGHEQAGKRPALVLSPRTYNEAAGLMLACPITSKVKSYPFEARLKAPKFDGAVLADQIRSLDWQARQVEFAGRAPAATTSTVQQLVGRLVQG